MANIPTVVVGTGNQQKVVTPALLTGLDSSGTIVPLKVNSTGSLLIDLGNPATLENLTVTGNLIVNGTTTTVNSSVISVADPILVVGSDTIVDSFDRGVAFKYKEGSVNREGFFGWDRSANAFTFLRPNDENDESDGTISGTTLGDARFGSVFLGANGIYLNGSTSLSSNSIHRGSDGLNIVGDNGATVNLKSSNVNIGGLGTNSSTILGVGTSMDGNNNKKSGTVYADAYDFNNNADGDDLFYIKVGVANTVTGSNSSAIGFNNTASALNSSAVGYLNAASGSKSSAVGWSNTASGYQGQSFGFYCRSLSNQSSAVGYTNTASANKSSAFGYTNTASALNSSAFGYSNAASGSGSSSAVGNSNTASGYKSSAFGYKNTASGIYSSAFGYLNTTSGYYSSAFGYKNTASEFQCSAVGNRNIASGNQSSAVGTANTSSGAQSSAVGYVNTVTGANSLAFGNQNTASGTGSSAFGYTNTASGNYSSAVGYNSKVYNATTTRLAAGDLGYVRIHGSTGMVAMTVQNRATEYTDAKATQTVTISGVVNGGNTNANVTLTNHGYTVGAKVTIAGATPSAYNGVKTVTAVTTNNVFTYLVSGTPGTTVTGTISATAENFVERDNTLARGEFAIRRNGLVFILDYNDGGTIKNLTLGTVT